MALAASVSPARATDETDACANAALAGQRSRDAGALTSARTSFLECARPVCPKPIRVDCTQWVSEVDAALPSVVLGAKSSSGADVRGVEVRIDGNVVDSGDGAKAVDVDPGTHQVQFSKPGHRTATTQFVARIGERNRPIMVTLDAAGGSGDAASGDARTAGTSRITPPVIALGAVGAVGLVSFATFGILGLSERSSLKDTCGNACTDAQISGLKTRFIVADISLVVGILGLGAATALYLTGRDASTASPPASARGLTLGPNGISF